MNHFHSSVPLSSSLPRDHLPPPRSVAPKRDAHWMRAGLLAGAVLEPLLVLWVGQWSSETLGKLAAKGQSATAYAGKVDVRC